MATVAGAHGERVALARELLTAKGRKQQRRFAFEGPTLFAEAVRSGAQILEIFATRGTYDENPMVREMESSGTPVYLVDDRTLAKLSDLETPSGLVAIAPVRFTSVESAMQSHLALLLADVNDPGNAGTLMRSAEAFGAQAVIFGNLGVEPHHPKVIRAAMGAAFRLPLAVATPAEAAAAAKASGAAVLGLDAAGEPLQSIPRAERTVLVVGHERHGLGPWAGLCTRRTAIPMSGPTESLNAAVAGSIALYALASRP